MKSNYKPFVDRMISMYEGGYGWDSGDAGGPTKYGITCYDLAEHRGQKMNSMSAWAPIVKALTLEEAEEIYAKKYAKGIRFDELRSGVDCVMMDYGVNSGIGRAIRVARAMVDMDYGSGMTTELVEAINAKDPKWFINTMCDERMQFLRSLSIWHIFKNGWTTRVADLREYATAVAAKKARPEETEPLPTVPKGTNVTPVKPTGPIALPTGAGVAAGLFGIPWWGIALIVLGVAVVTAAVMYYRRQAQERADKVVILPAPSVPPDVGVSNAAK